MPLTDDQLAAELARTAGTLLRDVRSTGLVEGRSLGDSGDQVSHAWLMQALRATRPDDGVLSEEGVRDAHYLEHDRIWIIDPLDGTREYSEGRDDWAVHVALVRDGAPIAAAVALPAVDEVHSTAGPLTPEPVAPRPLRIAVSRTRPPAVAQAVADELEGELVPMGSAGWKGLAVLCGEVDAYLHAGGMYEWDSCAPVGVALHAGLSATRLDGTPLVFGKAEPTTPELVISRPEHATALLDAIARHSEPTVESNR